MEKNQNFDLTNRLVNNAFILKSALISTGRFLVSEVFSIHCLGFFLTTISRSGFQNDQFSKIQGGETIFEFRFLRFSSAILNFTNRKNLTPAEK